METTTASYTRTTGLITILSAILAFGSMLFGALAVDWQLDKFSNPTGLLEFSNHHEIAKWAMLLDLFGYYLLLLPAIFYLHEYVLGQSPWANLLSFCGLSYVLIGAIGAAILASVWPTLMQQYVTVGAESKVILKAEMQNITAIVYGGMWNILEEIVAGVWWVGVGLALRGSSRPLGSLTVVLGISCLLDSLGNMTGVNVLADIGLNLYLVLAIIWPVWVGILIYKGALGIRKF